MREIYIKLNPNPLLEKMKIKILAFKKSVFLLNNQNPFLIDKFFLSHLFTVMMLCVLWLLAFVNIC